MATPRGLTHLAFAAPLDESTEDEVLDPMAGFPVLQNLRQDRRGGASKRLGFGPAASTRTDGTTRSSGRRLFSHNGIPCVIDSSSVIDTYVSALDINRKGNQVPNALTTIDYLPASTVVDSRAQFDITLCNGYLVFAYQASVGGALYIVVQVIESGSMTLLYETAIAISEPSFQVVAIGTKAFVVYADYADANVSQRVIDCTSTSTIATGLAGAVVLASDKAISDSNLCVEPIGSSKVAFAYLNNSGGANNVTVGVFDAAGTLTDSSAVTTTGSTGIIAIGGDTSDTVWVSWVESGTAQLVGLSPSSLATVTATKVAVPGTGTPLTYGGVVRTGAGAGSMLYTTTASSKYTSRSVDWSVSGGVITFGTQRDRIAITPQSKPLLRSGTRFAMFGDSDVDSFVGGHASVCDWATAAYPYSYAFPGLSGGSPGCHGITLDANRIAFVRFVVRTNETIAFALETLDFSSINRWRIASHNGLTFLSGGLLSCFDGDRVVEASFLQPPQFYSLANQLSGTGPTGLMHYAIAYEYVDASGNLTISGYTVIEHTGDGHNVLIKVSPLEVTWKSNGVLGVVRVALYRADPGSKIYYRIQTGLSNQGAVTQFTDDAITVGSNGEALLGGTGLLPGTGGAPLQREAPPFCADVVSFAGMLVVASGSDLWWSGQIIGGEGTWFSAEQFFVTVEGDGDITALAVQDGTLYVFKERAVWVVAGETPADNGSSGGLGTPRQLAGDVGCIEPTSVVVTSLGIFFRSHRGIELLSRGGGAMWIGEKVQTTLASYPYITSATLDARNNLVRFSLVNLFNEDGSVSAFAHGEGGDAGGGRDLVFDLVLNEWQSVDDKYGSAEHDGSQDACAVTIDNEERYAWLHADGTVYIESDDCLDNGTWITMAAETGWFKVSGIQGRQFFNRLLMLARKRTDADLSVSLGYNYSTSYAAQNTWTSANVSNLLTAGWPITQLRHDSNDDGEGQSIRVRIEDAEPTGAGAVVDTGRGATWLALTLDITPQDGTLEVPEEAA